METQQNFTKEDVKAKLGDRLWRLNNLYYIKDDKGNKILFRLNEAQQYLYDNLWFFNITPKARQLGMTTFFCILYLDQILFSENKTAAIIAHTQHDMKKIFRNKIKFAWDNLPPWLKYYIGQPDIDSANEMVFPNGSSISVTTSSRSDTVQFLHVSEFGKICARFPEKAAEIVSGAINSVHAGQMVSIESTAEGREGYFYEFCMQAEKNRKEGKELSLLDFKIFFFPWYEKDEYVLETTEQITKEFENYFNDLENKIGMKLSDGQKKWYISKKRIMKEKMFKEYPSTFEEAFQASTEGTYYASEMDKVYMEKRIRNVPYDPSLDVDTWWDLGMNDHNVIIFTQTNGPEIRIIDAYINRGEGLAHYVKVLKEKNYRYGMHNFPHDIEVREMGTGISRKDTLFNLGISNIIVVPKGDIRDGIERVRYLFGRFYFDETKTESIYLALANYRKDYDAKLGVYKSTPRHDDNSHVADAVRCLGVGFMGMHFDMKDKNNDNSKDIDESFFS